MNRFAQLHMLSFYPASNLNRDDLGRPKSVQIGGSNRLRISSQALKRAWRTSDVFEEELQGHIGRRTKNMGIEIFRKLVDGGVEEQTALKSARAIAEIFGKSKGEHKPKKGEEKDILQELEIEQLAHFTPEEETIIAKLINQIIEQGSEPAKDDLQILVKSHTAADVAMFGRMLAGAQDFNTEAAVQVSHAFTVNKVEIEDDFFTAVDDLNIRQDSGAGHMGSTEFGAGLFYLYICINKMLLLENLSNDTDVFQKTLSALVKSASQIGPTGKQNSFASRSCALYIMAEKGNEQPRSLSAAFIKPITGNDHLQDAVKKLQGMKSKMDNAYGLPAVGWVKMNVEEESGTLNDIITYVQED